MIEIKIEDLCLCYERIFTSMSSKYALNEAVRVNHKGNHVLRGRAAQQVVHVNRRVARELGGQHMRPSVERQRHTRDFVHPVGVHVALQRRTGRCLGEHNAVLRQGDCRRRIQYATSERKRERKGPLQNKPFIRMF